MKLFKEIAFAAALSLAAVFTLADMGDCRDHG